MSRDTTVIPFRQPEAIDDPLTEVAREGAQRLARVLIVEADAFVAQSKDFKLPDGRDHVVRHGHGLQRAIQTGDLEARGRILPPSICREWIGMLTAGVAVPVPRQQKALIGMAFQMVMARASAIACGHKDAIDLDRRRHDPLMKLAVGRCPQSGAALASQSTISRLENAPSKTEAARLAAALLDQFGTAVKPSGLEILDIDDTFCAAAWRPAACVLERASRRAGFASMHISITSPAARRWQPSCARRAPPRAPKCGVSSST
jgi:hypothetical protein